jgi:uncharacterized membrane protein YfcA
MSALTVTLLTLAILFVSTLTRSTFGFGDALIAMPLLSLIIGVQTATPLVAFVAPTIALTIVWSNWRSINLNATWRLIISSLIGIPVGVLVLKTAPEEIVKSFLGLAIILVSLYNLVKPRLMTLTQQKWAYLFGFVAGVLGGAYNTNGPPVVIYGALNRWPPERFRATLQGYFLPTGLFILVGHGLGGLWTAQVLRLYALALPVVLIAILLGGKLNRRIPPGRFEKFIYMTLVGLGLLLLVR